MKSAGSRHVPLVTARGRGGGYVGRRGAWLSGVDAMNSDVLFGEAEADEQILSFDIPDDVLERTGSAEHQAFTLFYCTNPSHNCGSPALRKR